MIENNVLFAALITLFAGLSTGIGSTLAFFSKRTNVSFLTFSLGFSAGVMIYISFVEIFFEGMEALQEAVGRIPGAWITVLAFFGGILLIGLIDRLVPSFENP
ncbi:MAG TPA: zinc transporter ZupT, partial [Kosmotogaceae bacterium]|nr:zinc transporter ZupT [Kosmotogaceae bacterium]